MHSRIFQISLNPIKENEYITASDYYEHWFIKEVADYVIKSYNRNDDIAWLKNATSGLEFGNDEYGNFLIIKSKEEYFEESFKGFNEALYRLKGITLKDFTKGTADFYLLKHAYEDKFGFYADVDGEVMSFDGFIRQCLKEEKYYIGGTLDYHS